MNSDNISINEKLKLLLIVSTALIIFIGTVFLSQSILGQQKKWTVQTHDKTNFPLVGKHRTVPCGDCHKDGVLAGTPSQCEACHWYRRQDDRYRLQLGISCGKCHTPHDWKKIKPAAWTHQEASGFLLQGAHKTLDCYQCHKGNTFLNKSVECYSCHKKDYANSNNPSHVAARFSTNCRECHFNHLTWEGALYAHTTYHLTGSHKTLDCSDCHISQLYSGLPSHCKDCHMNDYNKTVFPNHKILNFSTDCTDCHSAKADTWHNAHFDHSIYWPLRGAHKILSCSDCHSTGEILSSDCYSCHRKDYEEAKDPEHKKNGFSTVCTECHNPDAFTWDNAKYDHDAWPLQGAHKSLVCSACHSQGLNPPTDCYNCHKSDYDQTTSPNHKTSGFSTDCQSCHLPTHLFWTQAVFNHPFPITSGEHNNLDCSECHTTSNYSQFTCIECHAHSKNRMDGKHRHVTGYIYNSQACYGCHPDGN